MKKSRLPRSSPEQIREWRRRAAKAQEERAREKYDHKYRRIGSNRERRKKEHERAYGLKANAPAQPREAKEMTQLSLIEPTPTPAEVRTRTARWLDRLRDAIWKRYRGQVVTSDCAWDLMAENPELAIPDGVSPNALGKLFSDWPRAKRAGGFVRSERPEAHGNPLRTWRIR